MATVVTVVNGFFTFTVTDGQLFFISYKRYALRKTKALL